MFHDPELGRTTRGGQGHINDLPYKGNIEFLVTTKTPEQRIPTFDETVEWLMKLENRHMVLNVSRITSRAFTARSLSPDLRLDRCQGKQ